MKYFEFNGPYWALIKAETEEQAIEKYNEIVADYDEETDDEIKEVERDYALVVHARTQSDDGGLVRTVTETLEDFNKPEADILAITSELC
ncbi:hypothetical protein ABIE27_000357 [Paenibacillus sp. 4624]|uniref:hypothetical protein n=1 Tax=Paenibacillus sp. 4624 TaxID=3156453 RepID=UPI003D21E797